MLTNLSFYVTIVIPVKVISAVKIVLSLFLAISTPWSCRRRKANPLGGALGKWGRTERRVK